MGVLDDILNREFSIKYYGLNDLITGWHINKLIENESKIKEYFEKKESIIKTKDDFYDYLTLATIKRYQETVEYLKNDDLKPKIKSLIDFVSEKLNSFEKPDSQIYELINNDFLLLLNDIDDNGLTNEIVEIVLDYAFRQYDRVNREVFEYIENSHWIFILNNFDKCIGYYKNHKIELDSILRNIISNEGEHPYSNAIDFLIENKSTTFNDIFKTHAIYLTNKALTLSRSINDDNYLVIHSFYEDAYKLANHYDLGRQLREFEILKSVIENANDEYLAKHGSIIRYEFSTKEIIDELREKLLSQNVPINKVFLGLTHTKSKVDSKYEPAINSVFDYPKSVITDSIRHVGLESNHMFPPSVQMHLRSFFQLTDILVGNIIEDKELSELFFFNLTKVLEYISNDYNLDYKNLSIELNGIIDSIVYLFSIDNTYPFYRTFCFGLSQTICSYIEKILRKVYIEKFDDKVLYISESKLTLGSLLLDSTINKILGNKFTSILIFEIHYILERENGLEKKIGKNLRNKLMHNHDIDFMGEIHSGLVIHLFHILAIIIQQLEVTILKDSNT